MKPVPLFALCITGQWKKVSDLIESHPCEARKLLNTGKRGAAKISALQAVLAHPKCKGEAPLKLINELLKAAPEMALQKHLYTGNYPLHAVFYNAFFSASKRKVIADMITAACPSSIVLKNNEGRTALHTNCSQHCNYEPILSLLNAAPYIVTWADNNGDLPIHLACKSFKSPKKSIKLLFDYFPQSIFVKNNQGYTPLEVTLASGLPNLKLLSRTQYLKELEKVENKMESVDHEFIWKDHKFSCGRKRNESTDYKHQDIVRKRMLTTCHQSMYRRVKRRMSEEIFTDNDWRNITELDSNSFSGTNSTVSMDVTEEKADESRNQHGETREDAEIIDRNAIDSYRCNPISDVGNYLHEEKPDNVIHMASILMSFRENFLRSPTAYFVR